MDNKKSLIKKLTTLIIITGTIYACSYVLISGLLNEIVNEFNLTGAAEGLAPSLLSFGMMVAVIVFPALQGRIRKMTMIFISGIVLAVCVFFMGISQSWIMFAIFTCIMGLAAGGIDTFSNAIIIDMYPEDSSKPMGLFHGFYGLGSLIMPLVVTGLLTFTIWRSAYYIVAILMICAMVFYFIFKKKMDQAGGIVESQEKKLKLKDIGYYLKNKKNIIMLVISITLAMAQMGVTSWIARYMAVQYNMESLGAICITLYWIFATINRFLMPKIKIKGIKLLLYGSVLFAIFLLIGIFSGSPIVMSIMVSLCGLVSGHFCPVTFMVAAEDYKEATTLTTSINSLAMNIGRVLIPIIIGAVKAITDMNFGMVMTVIATVIGIAACFIFMQIKKKDVKEA